MKKYYKLISASMLLIIPAVFIACDKDDDDEFEVLSPIAGDYTGNESCEGTGFEPSDDYTMHIYNSANDANTIWIENFYGLDLKLKGSVNGNSFTLPLQEFDWVSGANTYHSSIKGTGTVDGDILTFDFVTTEDLADSCRFIGNRHIIQPAVGSK